MKTPHKLSQGPFETHSVSREAIVEGLREDHESRKFGSVDPKKAFLRHLNSSVSYRFLSRTKVLD